MKRYIWLCMGLILCVVLTGCSDFEQAVTDIGDSLLSQANGDVDALPEESAASSEKTPTANGNAEQQYTVERIRSDLEALLEGAAQVMDVFYGTVAVADEPVNDAEGNATTFYPVADERFRTVDDLKAFAEQYYTNAFAVAAFYADALESDYPTFRMMGDLLCRNADVGGFSWEAEWDFDTLEITQQTDYRVTVSMAAVINGEAVESMPITMVMVDGSWRLDDSLLH